ncbi:hypothetical protein [Croceimicrobium sp.]|uniref:hypothetical protein n=1 Tax=Croceimicrobium sp. TaxID=2828340 RepID=UPI003BAD24C4
MMGTFSSYEIVLILILLITPPVLAVRDLRERQDMEPKQKLFWALFISLFLFFGSLIYGLYRFRGSRTNQ